MWTKEEKRFLRGSKWNDKQLRELKREHSKPLVINRVYGMEMEYEPPFCGGPNDVTIKDCVDYEKIKRAYFDWCADIADEELMKILAGNPT